MTEFLAQTNDSSLNLVLIIVGVLAIIALLIFILRNR